MPRKPKVTDAPEIEYRWRDGFVAPKGIEAAAVKAAIYVLPRREPEALYEASKDASHVLHDELWNEGDQEWARRGRLEHCRRIMANLVEVRVIGGRTIETRVVEYIRQNGDGRWVTIEDILNDKQLLDSYLAEVMRLQDQAVSKLARVRELMQA